MPSELINTDSAYTPHFLKILSRRGLESSEMLETFLGAELSSLHDPYRMKGMKEAVDRILAAKKADEKVMIHGDYDVDGITGASILSKTLEAIGIGFEVFLPDRAEDGYGISDRAIEVAREKGISLLVTVDCGIAAAKQIGLAREYGLEVIILDHHKIPETGLPPANIILNPLQEDCQYPFQELSAGGLAFKLAQALLGDASFQLLDLASISTVCDVAPVVDENRIIVKNGLESLFKRKNAGLKALMEVAGVKTSKLNVGHIGFMIGPRINAAGRMSTPDIALRLLLSQHDREAKSLAVVLNEENKARQKEERLVTKEAVREVERSFNFNRDRVIVVAKEGWHQGVIGIVASRLVEKFNRPAVVIALDGDSGKGSGRSIKSFNLFNALNSCRDLCEEFGGHAQAAGLSIKTSQVDALRRQVNEFAAAQSTPEDFVKKFDIDLEIGFKDLRNPFLNELELLEPHGVGNPRPQFLTRNLTVKTKPVRVNPQNLQFWATDGEYVFEVMWHERYGSADAAWLLQGIAFDLIYSVKIKTWSGRENLILEAKDIKQLS